MKNKSSLNANEFIDLTDGLEKLGLDLKDCEIEADKNGKAIVNFDGNINLSYKGLSEILVKFGHVSGDFECQSNELTSLDFAPEFVGGCFNCSNNNINDFDNIPIKHVEGNFYAYGADPDKLSKLKGIVKGKIYPSH